VLINLCELVEHISVHLVQCTLEESAVDCRLQGPAKTGCCSVPVLLTLCIFCVRLDGIDGE
jgi:hypothetical protein